MYESHSSNDGPKTLKTHNCLIFLVENTEDGISTILEKDPSILYILASSNNVLSIGVHEN